MAAAPPQIPNGTAPPQALPPAAPPPPTDLKQRKALMESEVALFKALIARVGDHAPGKLKLSDTENQQLTNYIIRDFEDADSANRKYKKNIAKLSENWRGTVTPKTFPFEGAANIRVPLTSVFVEQTKARWRKAMFSGEQWSKISLLEPDVDAEALKEANQWWQWELAEIVKLKDIVGDALLHQVLVQGISTPIPSYEHHTRMLHSVKKWEYDANQPLSALIEEGIQEIINEKSEWGVDIKVEVEKQSRPGEFKLKSSSDGGKPEDGGRIVFSLDLDRGKLQADIWRRDVIFDGVKINLIELEDLVVANTRQSIDQIPFFGVRLFLSMPEYRDGIEDGFFIDYGEEENNRIANTADIKWGQEIGQQQTDIQDREEGTDSRDSYAYTTERKFLETYRWEGWWRWGQGENANDKVIEPAVQIAVWVAYRARKIIKIERLEDLNKDGKRSAVKFGFIEEPGRFYPMGMAEWVRHVQAELDAIHNQRLDAGLLFNVPFGFYKPTAGLKGVISIEPGKFFPVADPSGVNMPRSNWQPTFSMAEEQLVKRYAGEQAGLTDAALGMPTSKRQSASEFVGTASALDLRTEEIVERLLQSLRELLYRILSLYQQFGPRERIFRVGGEEGVQLTKRFEKDRLSGKILLQMLGDLDMINESAMKETAINMFQLLQNELLVMDGIVRADTRYEAIKVIAKLAHYDNVPLHRPDTPPESDAPDIENHQLFGNFAVKGPTMTENTSEHLQIHSMLAADAQTMNSWPPDARMRLQQHIQKTIQMQQAQMIVKQQQALLATQAAQGMAKMGINPGMGGSNPGDQAGAGTKNEGVRNTGGGPTAPSPVGQ